jgi:ribosomal-protein-alanine N-acetyltransferase
MSAVLKDVPYLAPMREHELDEVMAIESAIYTHPWTRGNFGDSLRAGYACRTWRLATGRNAALVGYFVVSAAVGEAHLLNLSIAPAYQRSGHGSALLREAAALARQLGADKLFLEVRPSNQPAQALYRRFGFRKVGVRRGYYPARSGREDALVLALPLK